MTANQHRGEVSVELSGVSHTARPTYQAILAYEQETGRSSSELMMRFSAGVFTLREIVAILHACLTAGGLKLSHQQLGEQVVDGGQTEFLKPCGYLLRNALTGGKQPDEGEAEAVRAPAASRTAD
jgi:hypothetical protein